MQRGKQRLNDPFPVLPRMGKVRMKGKSKKILNALTTIIVAMVVILAVMLVGVRLFGLQV